MSNSKDMKDDEVSLYVVGLQKDEPISELLYSKFGSALKKYAKTLPEIIEAKISVKSQNSEGNRTHYDVTSIVTTSKTKLIYTESGWDVLKISDRLCRKLEDELSKHDNKRQKTSIRKRGDF